MARNSYDWNNGELTFSNSAGKVTLSIEDVPVQTHGWLVEYGLKQWLGSFLARAANGSPSTYLATAKEAFARAQAGEFLTRGSGLAIEALMPEVIKTMAIAAKSPEKAEDWLNQYLELTDAAKEQFRGKEVVKTAINKVKADRRLAGAETGEGDFDPFA